MAIPRSESITIGPVSVYFPHLFVPNKPKISQGDDKYNSGFIISEAIYQQLIPLMTEFAQQAFPGGEFNQPRFDWGVRPCAERPEKFTELAVAEGMYAFNAKAGLNFKPQVVDRNHQPILDPGVIRDGAQCYISINFYANTGSVDKGLGVGLGPVMYVEDGESLSTGGGGVTSQEAFAGVQLPPGPAGAAPNLGAPAYQPPPVQQAPAPTQAPAQAAPIPGQQVPVTMAPAPTYPQGTGLPGLPQG